MAHGVSASACDDRHRRRLRVWCAWRWWRGWTRRLHRSRRGRSADACAVRATRQIPQGSRSPQRSPSFSGAAQRIAGARASHAAASARWSSRTGAYRESGQADAPETGGARGDTLRAGQLRARRAARKRRQTIAGPHERRDRRAAQDLGNPGRDDGERGAAGAVLHRTARPGILGTSTRRKQKGSPHFRRGLVRPSPQRARVSRRHAAPRRAQDGERDSDEVRRVRRAGESRGAPHDGHRTLRSRRTVWQRRRKRA